MILSEALWLALVTNAVAALAFYLVYSAGQLNVSQPGFMAMGAYAVGLATTNGVPLWQGAALGLVLITAVAVLLALVTARLGGVYLAMATLAFVVVVQQLIIISPNLGGAVGIPGIPRLLSLGWGFLALLLVAVFVRTLMRTRLGYEMRTAREDTISARSVGIDLRRLRIKTAILSAWVAGAAGGMEALHSSFVGPSDFGFATLIVILGIAIVGGTDRWWGPVLGAVFLTVLPELTRATADYREIVAGVLILGVMVAFPEGLVGVVLRAKRLVTRRRSPKTPPPPRVTPASEPVVPTGTETGRSSPS